MGKTAGIVSLLRKLRREQKRGMKGEGKGEKCCLLPPPPLPPFVVVVVVVFAKILQAFTRSETFVTQAYVQKEFNFTTGLVWDSYIASVSLFWDINMVDVMSCEK